MCFGAMSLLGRFFMYIVQYTEKHFLLSFGTESTHIRKTIIFLRGIWNYVLRFCLSVKWYATSAESDSRMASMPFPCIQCEIKCEPNIIILMWNNGK